MAPLTYGRKSLFGGGRARQPSSLNSPLSPLSLAPLLRCARQVPFRCAPFLYVPARHPQINFFKLARLLPALFLLLPFLVHLFTWGLRRAALPALFLCYALFLSAFPVRLELPQVVKTC